MTSQPHQSTECPQTLSCPLSAIAVEIIQKLSRIEEASKGIPQLVKRVDDLERTRDEQRGMNAYRRRSTTVFITVMLAFLTAGTAVWSALHKDSEELRANLAGLQSRAVDTAQKAEANQGSIAIVNRKAEAAEQLQLDNSQQKVIYKTYRLARPKQP